MNEINNRLRDRCQDAHDVFVKLNDEHFEDIRSRLEYVIGSYDFDKNPVGLHEMGMMASKEMKTYKKANPRKINKKVIERLDSAIRNYENLN